MLETSMAGESWQGAVMIVAFVICTILGVLFCVLFMAYRIRQRRRDAWQHWEETAEDRKRRDERRAKEQSKHFA